MISTARATLWAYSSGVGCRVSDRRLWVSWIGAVAPASSSCQPDPCLAVLGLGDAELGNVELRSSRAVEGQRPEGDDPRARGPVAAREFVVVQRAASVEGRFEPVVEHHLLDRAAEADPDDVGGLEEPTVARTHVAQEPHDVLVATNC
jgi:hypothetical protein